MKIRRVDPTTKPVFGLPVRKYLTRIDSVLTGQKNARLGFPDRASVRASFNLLPLTGEAIPIYT